MYVSIEKLDFQNTDVLKLDSYESDPCLVLQNPCYLKKLETSFNIVFTTEI